MLEFGASAPPIPYVRNYFKNERLYPLLRDFLAGLISREHIDLVHGQHVLTCLPAIAAARGPAVPAVCTVRDYWPVCYWSDLIHTTDDIALCPGCSSLNDDEVRPSARAGALAGCPADDSLHARESRRASRRGLAAADAIVAVSTTIAADLRSRAPEIPRHQASRSFRIPSTSPRWHAAGRASAPPMPGPYALYIGKLAPNKGTSHLVPVIERASLDWPLVIAGTGPEDDSIAAAAARSTRDVHMIGWIDQPAAAAWMAHASMLIFTSRGPESLSRVLIEASALGVPIAAMNTGGTTDIIGDEESGLLSNTPDELADDVRRLRRWRAASPVGGGGAHPRGGAIRRTSRRCPHGSALPGAHGREPVTRPLRVAVVSRAVYPLHGLGGLERSVYDLVRHLAARGIEITLITRPAERATKPDTTWPDGVAVRFVPYRTFPFAGRRGTTILESRHRVPAVRRTRRAGCLGPRDLGGRRPGPRLRRQRPGVRPSPWTCDGAARAQPARPRGVRGIRSLSGEVEARGVSATSPGGACVRPRGGLRHRDRSQPRADCACPSRTGPGAGVRDPECSRSSQLDALATEADGVSMRARRKSRPSTPFSSVSAGSSRTKGSTCSSPRWRPSATMLERSGKAGGAGSSSVKVPSVAPSKRRSRVPGSAIASVLTGRLPDRELHAWYEAANLFVHPTLYKGSSLVTLEAMAHRRAVVATTAGGLTDKVRPGVNGWLVPPGDASALAAAISGALGRPEQLPAFGLAGRAIVERGSFHGTPPQARQSHSTKAPREDTREIARRAVGTT